LAHFFRRYLGICFWNVLRSGSGFDPRQCLTAQIKRNYPEAPEKTAGFVQQLLTRLQALPGAQVAAVASALPLQPIGPNSVVVPGDGPLPPRAQWPAVCVISVSPEYFRAAGTPFLRGRSFSDDDNAHSVPVAVVNQAFAKWLFNGDALDRRVRTNIGAKDVGQFTPRTIVGVVQNVRYNGPEGGFRPVIYLPIEQAPQLSLNILLRTTVQPGSLSSAMRKTVTDVDPVQPLFDMQTMEERISESVAQRLRATTPASNATIAMDSKK